MFERSQNNIVGITALLVSFVGSYYTYKAYKTSKANKDWIEATKIELKAKVIKNSNGIVGNAGRDITLNNLLGGTYKRLSKNEEHFLKMLYDRAKDDVMEFYMFINKLDEFEYDLYTVIKNLHDMGLVDWIDNANVRMTQDGIQYGREHFSAE